MRTNRRRRYRARKQRRRLGSLYFKWRGIDIGLKLEETVTQWLCLKPIPLPIDTGLLAIEREKIERLIWDRMGAPRELLIIDYPPFPSHETETSLALRAQLRHLIKLTKCQEPKIVLLLPEHQRELPSGSPE